MFRQNVVASSGCVTCAFLNLIRAKKEVNNVSIVRHSKIGDRKHTRKDGEEKFGGAECVWRTSVPLAG